MDDLRCWMRIIENLLVKSLFFAVLLFGPICFWGCQGQEVQEQPLRPIFFPGLPEQPKLQFFKSYADAEDLGVKTISGFDRFLFGEPEHVDYIGKPYGVALYEKKMYVCDIAARLVAVLDLENKTFRYLSKDRRLRNPVNIYIDTDGSKYITDTGSGSVFVFNKQDTLINIMGEKLDLRPVDIVVGGDRCYVTDSISQQVVVLNKRTGEVINRIGKVGVDLGEFQLISNIAIDAEENIYVTDMVLGRITKFDKDGIFLAKFGQVGDAYDEFARPKGVAVDREGRIWVADAASQVVKVIDPNGQLLLFFGLPGDEPGQMNLPAKVYLDYDNVDIFQQYAVEGAELEFLVIITNQFGPNKVSVYGFGKFPFQEEKWQLEGEQKLKDGLEPESE